MTETGAGMKKPLTGAEIRQSFIDFFAERGHTVVPSSSLVPGGDQTLLFTNAGMVQFKDVFLGTDRRSYTRAVDSQKCMRVAGKHNDLDDVGRDNTHHTFFEMLGNWSFGDYYKQEAISWAWELLTEVWGLEKNRLWMTCFKDDQGNIPTDEEAADIWRSQPGINPEQVLYFGRKDNLWEMAETGPCGPCSEIHFDQGPEFCNKSGKSGHECHVNGDCSRFVELWNLVFIQYNRLSATDFQPLPATHVDTGMGFERIVAVMQGVHSNYRTDLLSPLLDKVQEMTGHSLEEREANLTPYRVIADHSRAAAFLIADGVVPGNTGRNYICRMIVRRAARFGSKIGLNAPFMAQVADVVISNYGAAYPELLKNRKTILENLTREEKRFQRTVETGLSHLNDLLEGLREIGQPVLDGKVAFDLYATHGLPLELTRDIAREQGLEVEESGFREAMEDHRIASGAGGQHFGGAGGDDVEVFRTLFEKLVENGKLTAEGIIYQPYTQVQVEGEVLGLVCEGEAVTQATQGEIVDVLLPATCFYIESGGQVSDHGVIRGVNGTDWEIEVEDMRKPADGLISHVGKVVRGTVKVGEIALAAVDSERRFAIMRNHTATHLLHAALHQTLGEHARQAGSLVAPDRLRFDFTHPEAVSQMQLAEIEEFVNQAILKNYDLNIATKSRDEAIAGGAMALFGEKYGETVRTISIGEETPFSYELCGGTHVDETGMIGLFLVTSESSVAAGIRRIEAVTGQGAYQITRKRLAALRESAALLGTSLEDVPARIEAALEEQDQARKEMLKLRQKLAAQDFIGSLENVPIVGGFPVLVTSLPEADADILRQMTDRFRERYAEGVIVLGSVQKGKPVFVVSVSDDLVSRGVHAGEIVKVAATVVGGGGGGRPNMAQAGGKDAEKLGEALEQALHSIRARLEA
jgi:alanyl-tRNA synthetase